MELSLFPFADPEDSQGFLLWQIHMGWLRRMNAALRSLDLTFTQFSLLAALAWLQYEENAAIPQYKVARHIQLDKMTTSKVIATLKKKKLLQIRRDPADKRLHRMTLTDNGRQALDQAFQLVYATDEKFFRLLGPNRNAFYKGSKFLLHQAKEEDRQTTN